MDSIETLREILGWCSVINIGLLMLTSITLVAMRRSIAKVHATMFELSAVDLSNAYFQYLAQYKIAILVLNLVPYVALRIMT